jgi:hypothetical protein
MARTRAAETGTRLHIGSGRESISGWINIDSQMLPGVDLVLDVRRGLPYSDVEAIYCEHFLEHLTLREGLNFLRECRRVLTPEGVIRLSTPNLDWVYATHYHFGDASMQVSDCLSLNRAFHGWGHRFLYNRGMLEAAFADAGFVNVTFHRYSESETPFLRDLERHEKWIDTADLPHVLIAEGRGSGQRRAFPAELLNEHEATLALR